MRFIGVVRTIVVKNQTQYFNVASKHAPCRRNAYGQVECMGVNLDIACGLPAVFTGELKGAYVHITEVTPSFTTEKDAVNYIKKRLSAANRTVQLKTISKIVSYFGNDLFSISEKDMRTKLNEEFDELGTSIDDILYALFSPIDPYKKVREFVRALNLNDKEIESLYDDFGGDDVIRSLKRNPYPIFRALEIPIKKADLLAKQNGMDAFDQKRMVGFMENTMDAFEREGHTYATGKSFSKKFLNAINHGAFYETVHKIHLANAMKKAKTMIITDDGFVSLKERYKEERGIAEKVHYLLDKTDITEVNIQEIEDELGLQFSASQKSTIEGALSSTISVITGGPGSGKTTTVSGVLAAFRRKTGSNNFILCAPTGRAASRLAESTGHKAMTIHRLLGMTPNKEGLVSLKHNQNNPIDADLIIVDETSMNDTEITYLFLSAVKKGTIVIFVGDENQLPSVGAGNCLHDIIASGVVPVFRLNEVFRQKSGSGVLTNKDRIANGLIPEPTDDFQIFEFDSPEEAKAKLYQIVKKEYRIDDPYYFQVIEPVNEEVNKTNAYVHEHIMFPGVQFGRFHSPIVGDKLMFLKNAYSDDEMAEPLYTNGEMGVFIKEGDSSIVIKTIDDKVKRLKKTALFDTKLSYSATVHKMQGSEAPVVAIYLPQGCNKMMYRNLLYTAVTRAKLRVVLIAVRGEIEKCVMTPAPVRNTRLSAFLGGGVL